MTETLLPESLKKYFWDCDFDHLSMNNYAFFICERILNYGDMLSLQWLLSQIDKTFLIEVIDNSKNLNEKTRNYWNLVLHES
jgi:hypothetical protein